MEYIVQKKFRMFMKIFVNKEWGKFMKLLIAGSGFIVHDWLKIAKEIDGVELIAITGRNESVMKELQGVSSM